MKGLATIAIGVALATVSAPRSGQLVQLTGKGACVSQLDTAGSCADGRGLNAPDAVTVSPDGRSVYVASFGVFSGVLGNRGSIAVFSRSSPEGRIAQTAGRAGCLGPSEEGCATARGIDGTSAVVISPDGRNLYATGLFSGSVTAFSRSASGELTQLPGPAGCVNDDGTDGCGDGNALAGALGAAISRDGRNVYVASYDADSVAVFDRDPATGRLRQPPGPAGCVEQLDEDGQVTHGCSPGVGLSHAGELVVSPDGLNVYVLSGNALALFRRGASGALTQLPGQTGCFSSDGSDGACAPLPPLEGGLGLAISPEGLNIYVASYVAGSIVSFRRDPATGGLTPLPGSAAGLDSDGVSDVVVSPDGAGVYAVSPFHDAVLAFARQRGGALAQLPGQAACVSDLQTGDACAHGEVLTRASALAVSPDGRNVYVASVEPVGAGCACGQELGSLSVFARRQPLTLSLVRPMPGQRGVHAGRSFSIMSRVRTTAGSVSVSCVAKVGARLIHTSPSYTRGAAKCSGVVPKESAGKRLTGAITATVNGTAKTTIFSFPIGN